MEDLNIQNNLIEKFTGDHVSFDETSDMLAITANKMHVFEVIKYLKEAMGFQFLTDLCGIHYPDQELALGVIYHLHNFDRNLRIRVKTFTSVADAAVPSIHELFSAANWMERETFDFFGINFTNHPNLIRILNVEYLDYFPLRKEFPLEDPTRTDKDDRFFGR